MQNLIDANQENSNLEMQAQSHHQLPLKKGHFRISSVISQDVQFAEDS